MMRNRTRGAAALAALPTSALLLTGCALNAAEMPLPGTQVSGPTVTLAVTFDDALNLTVGAPITINGLDVGRVQKLSTNGYQAVVQLRVRKSASLRLGTTARLRYDTPLGQVFVEMTTPTSGPTLDNGSVIDDQHTSTAATVEDTLASASLLINGGGLNQIGTIATELRNATPNGGRPIRDVLEQSKAFLTRANQTTGTIERSLRSLAGVSVTLRSQQGLIKDAVRQIGPTAQALAANTGRFTALLAHADTLAQRADAFVVHNRQAALSLLEQSGPIFDQITSLRGRLVSALDSFSSAAAILNAVIPGDWVPILISGDLGSTLLTVTGPVTTTPGSTGGGPAGPSLPGLLGGLLTPTPPSSAPGGTVNPTAPVGGLLSLILGGN